MIQVLLTIERRSEDGKIAINTNIPDPLILLSIITAAQQTLIQQAQIKMELKQEAKIITHEQLVRT